MLERIRNLAAAVLLGAATAFSWVTADHETAAELHFLLENTNTEDSFDAAKETLYTDIERRDDGTMVCRYSGDVVTLVADGTKFKPDADDGIQAEHTWASKAAWVEDDEPGRFERDSVEGADLHNLFPVRSGINGSRGNDPFGEPVTDRKEYGLSVAADKRWKVDWSADGRKVGSFVGKDADGDRVFEPRDDHKGDVARVMFYMSVRYWWAIPEPMEKTLKAWHTEDPPDDEERARNDRVEAQQHNRNPFVDEPELVGEISDF